MEEMKIPRFENETAEAEWLYEHRKELAAEFMLGAQEGRVHKGVLRHGAQVESVLLKALQTGELAVSPEELEKRSLVEILREKLG